jgi:hypothetical protein
MKIFLHMEQTHDVSDHKGVSLKRRKHAPLFSMEYLQETDGHCAVKPTMCMIDKDLWANGQGSAILYVIENKTRSFLASKKNDLRSHDEVKTK